MESMDSTARASSHSLIRPPNASPAGEPLTWSANRRNPPPGARPSRSRPVRFSRLFLDGDVHHRDDEVFWRHNGSSFPVEYTCTPLRWKTALLWALWWSSKSITERKEQELEERNRQRELELRVQGRTHELHQANLQLSAVLEAASLVAVIAITPANKITIFNSGAERMLGYTAKEIVGSDLSALHLPGGSRIRIGNS